VGGAGTPVDLVGVLLCLSAGLSDAAYTLATKTLVPVAPPAVITLSAFGVAALLALPAAWVEAGVPTVRAADAAAVLYVGVVTAGVAYLLYSHALHHVSAATGVTLALAEPVVAFLLALAVVGERPPVAACAGLLLVVSGVAVVVRTEMARART
jgi:DME family drug/metabolite transporter